MAGGRVCGGGQRQRRGRHRAGRLLVPHGAVAGLLFTVDPRRAPRALRELRLFLHPLIADLEQSEREQREREREREREGEKSEEEEEEGEKSGEVGKDAAPSTSSLLAAELAAARDTHYGKEKGEDDNVHRNNNNIKNNHNDSRSHSSSGDSEGDGGDSAPFRKRFRAECAAGASQWLTPLETGCKGHVMLRIPFLSQTLPPNSPDSPDLPREDNSLREDKGEGEKTAPSGGAHAHAVVRNPLVHTVVERIFKDIEENPRPLLRNCFRLMPGEVTCCPTLPEMRLALEQLIDAHFPNEAEKESRRLRRVGLSFKVKNNTNVEGKKAYLQAALESFFPANRFVVIPAARVKSGAADGVEAMFCAFVAHATCVMGVQQQYSQRGEFNIHAIGAKHLELANSV